MAGATPRATAARPRRRDRQATSEALLAAAVEVFARRGYEAATTREVAAAAGVSEVLIQRYFGGKAGLLLAVLENCNRPENRGACGMPPLRSTVREEIDSFLEFHLKHAWEHRDFIRVVVYRSMVDPAVAAEIGRKFVESRVPGVRERLETLRAKGRIARGADIDSVAHALATLSFGLAFMDQVVHRVSRKRLRAVAAGFASAMARGIE
ncbi:MAG TPA: helix-turn-helix domain-containing protein, partial [Planctomycetota bacterium]|nr:helix-turn-helix domain-containing protein [Planctomycetota bacterium]